MGTLRLGTFPSLNNKGLQDDIAKSVLNSKRGKKKITVMIKLLPH